MVFIMRRIKEIDASKQSIYHALIRLLDEQSLEAITYKDLSNESKREK